MKEKLIKWKEEIDKSIIIVENFHTLFSATDRTTIQKIHKDIDELNRMDQED